MHVSRLLRPVVPLLVGAALGCCLRPAAAQSSGESVVPVIPENESPFFVLDDGQPGANNDGPRRGKKELVTPANQYPLNKSSEASASRNISVRPRLFSTSNISRPMRNSSER